MRAVAARNVRRTAPPSGKPVRRRFARRLAALALGASVGLAAASVCSAAPTGISYVGELRAENGVLYTGMVAAEASIFDAASGGAAVWGPADLGDVMVNQGLFSVVLGGQGGAGLDTALMNHDNLWIGLTLDGVPLEPRQRLHATPYARVAAHAQNIGTIAADQVASLTDLAEHPTAAHAAETAPENPVAGQLWLDTAENKVYVWSAGQWLPVSVAGLEPGDLPFDGLNDVSNGTLSNEFFDVQASWGGGPAAIPDNNAAGINATIAVDEGSQARLYALEFSVVLQVSVVSQIKLVLQPPVSTGVNPIVLFDSTLAPQGGNPTDVTMVFNPNTHPSLAALIDKGPAGQWILNVSDDEFTVVSGVEIAKLQSFDMLYDVLRSDEVLMSGDFHVMGDQSIGGDLTLGGSVQADGGLNVTGPIHGKHIMWSGGCTNSGSAGGWNPYCTDGLDFSTIDGYLDVNPNGTFTVLKPGFYNVNYFGIQGQASGWYYSQVVVNGTYRHHGHNRGYGNHQDLFIDFTWKYNEGDQFYVQILNGGEYAFHSWNAQGAHSRLQVTFLGE